MIVWYVVRCSSPAIECLVRNSSERGGPGKPRSFWENEIHVVVRRKGPDSPVYEVKAETNGTKIRVLHRNLLLPCNYLPVEEPLTDPARTMSRPVSPQQLRKRQNSSLTNPAASESENCETSTDDENRPDMIISVIPRILHLRPRSSPKSSQSLQNNHASKKSSQSLQNNHASKTSSQSLQNNHTSQKSLQCQRSSSLQSLPSNHGKQERDNHQTG